MDLSYYSGVYTDHMQDGYRLCVVQDEDAHADNPLDWGREDITKDSEVYKQWARGDVYIVAVEKLKTYYAEDGTTIREWDVVEAIGGNYLRPDHTGYDAARDHGFPGLEG